MAQKHILIIDDDEKISQLLAKFLQQAGFLTSIAANAYEAQEKINFIAYDLLVLDVMMPKKDGVGFLGELRQVNQNIPVIMLTAMGGVDDRIKGLEAGADDYLPKPFEPKELLLRIKGLLKRNIDANDAIKFGPFSFDLTDLRLQKDGSFIHLTASEAKILKVLCANLTKQISRKQMSEELGAIDERSIDVAITRLRKKIEENPKKPLFLQTIRNFGYVLYR